MGQPSWREICTVTVPDRAANIWTPALDYVAPTKLYKLVVKQTGTPPDEQRWKPAGSTGAAATADGDPSAATGHAGLLGECALGALIAKIGGSAADAKPDPAKVMLFSVGRHCVFSVELPAKPGTLYLGVNNASADLSKLSGTLEVTISEAL
jgi:hypothetical protein